MMEEPSTKKRKCDEGENEEDRDPMISDNPTEQESQKSQSSSSGTSSSNSVSSLLQSDAQQESDHNKEQPPITNDPQNSVDPNTQLVDINQNNNNSEPSSPDEMQISFISAPPTLTLDSVMRERDELKKEVARLQDRNRVYENTIFQLKASIQNIFQLSATTLAQPEISFIPNIDPSSPPVSRPVIKSIVSDSFNEISAADQLSSLSTISTITTSTSNEQVLTTTSTQPDNPVNMFIKLSAEIVVYIVNLISIRDLLELTLVCKEWKQMIYHTPVLWRKLEWKDITPARREMSSICDILRLSYFQWLLVLDLGKKGQSTHKDTKIDEVRHFHSKEIQMLSKALGLYCKNLRSLTICVARLYDATLKSISESCLFLETLILDSAKKTIFTDDGLAYITNLVHLRVLSLPSSEHYSDRGISRLTKKIGANFQTLRLTFLNGPGITHFAYDKITNSALKYISQYCTSLTKLAIRGHESLTSAGLDLLSQGCANLTSINFSFCPTMINEAGLLALSSKCKQLRKVNLSCCGVTNAGLFALATGCSTSLIKLNLSLNFGISDEGLAKMSVLCTNLKKLILQGCSGVTNAGLISVKKGCPKIKLIDARGTMASEEVWDEVDCVEL